MFLHKLQCKKGLQWDDNLTGDEIKEWKLISKQANSSPPVKVPRFVGKREGSYQLIACVDASLAIYGAVIFIKDLSNGKNSFVLAKSRIVNTVMSTKSIPSLELQAIVFGLRLLSDIKNELSGQNCVVPVKISSISLFSDSLVALSWVNSWTHGLEKMNKRSTFVINKLNEIEKICREFPVDFKFISGSGNPADFITRCVSYKLLMKSNYFLGPSEEQTEASKDVFSFKVPNPNFDNFSVSVNVVENSSSEVCHIIPLEFYSNFQKLVKITACVVKCAFKWKNKVVTEDFCQAEASNKIFVRDQSIEFPEVVQYFGSQNKAIKRIPDLVSQLNLYMDKSGLIRVKGKFSKSNLMYKNFPILLSKKSRLTELIVWEFHEKFKHSGIYHIIKELRKLFWIPHIFSVVKKIIKNCIVCKRYKTSPVQLNQSCYRDQRVEPGKTPFSYVYIDHFGPYFVKFGEKKIKVWVLIITCMFTRSINLKVSLDMTTTEFLRAFQLHVFNFGLPQFVVSDLGTQIRAGADIITNFLSDDDTKKYFNENSIKPIQFDCYFRGCSSLGSLVEVCVRMSKHLIHKSIKNYVLDIRDFEFMIEETKSILNKRPLTFKDALRDSSGDVLPPIITPENLIFGYDLVTVNVVPDLQPDTDLDKEFLLKSDTDKVKDINYKLRNVRGNLLKIYQDEFLSNLMYQSVDKKGRYSPVNHQPLEINDIVLIKDPNTKSMNLSMGIVRKVYKNNLGESVNAEIMRGKTREITRRHTSNLVLLLKANKSEKDCNIKQIKTKNVNETASRPVRHSALVAKEKIRTLFDD